MKKYKYRIEANNKTLARFMTLVGHGKIGETFVHRVTPDVNEEHYYVVLTATDAMHDALHGLRFTDRQKVK